MNDCCTICTATSGCAVSVFSKTGSGQNGSCALKKTRTQPVNNKQAATFLPPGVPVPPPIITQQVAGAWIDVCVCVVAVLLAVLLAVMLAVLLLVTRCALC
jgi:hypothetical protein